MSYRVCTKRRPALGLTHGKLEWLLQKLDVMYKVRRGRAVAMKICE